MVRPTGMLRDVPLKISLTGHALRTTMTEPTEVEARFAEDGKITVLSFTWRRRKLPVLGGGRQWSADDGFHFLVMTTGEQIFELVYHSTSGLWHIAKAPDRKMVA